MSCNADNELIELVDLNDLFKLTYSFDALKRMIESMYNHQKMLGERVAALEEGHGKIDTLSDSQNLYRKTKEKFTIEESDKRNLEDVRQSSLDNSSSQPGHMLQQTISDNNQQILSATKHVVSLEKKIKVLETNLKTANRNILALQAQNIESQAALKEKDNQSIDPTAIKLELDALKEKDNERFNQMIGINEVLDQIKVKVSDFDVFSLFKDTQIEGGSVDASTILIKALETKVFKKFGMVDDKIKQSEHDIIKNKNDLINLKIQYESSTFTMNNVIEGLSQKLREVAKNQVDTTEKFDDITKQLETLKTKHHKLKQKNKQEHQTFFNNMQLLQKKFDDLIEKTEDILNNKDSGVNETFFSKFKEALTKKIHDIENKLYDSNPNAKIQALERQLNELFEIVKNKSDLSSIAYLQDKIIGLTGRLDYAKDAELNLLDSNDRLKRELDGLNKKIESVISSITGIKNEGPNTKIKREAPIDFTKFLDMKSFEDYKKYDSKEKDKIHRENGQILYMLTKLSGEVQLKANEVDLRRAEEYLIGCIDDMKRAFHIKYVDKIELNKTFKILEHQIRHINDMTAKPGDRGDTWLLAKRPIGGHNCASCEAHIGDLGNSSNDYLPWNKIAAREPLDMAGYRTGNGFSRIMSMIDLKKSTNSGNGDIHEKNKAEFESDNEIMTQNKRNLEEKKRNTVSSGMLKIQTEETDALAQQELNIVIESNKKITEEDPKVYVY